jgi:N-acyl-D-aspartate/D-glutamate deacylase
MKYDLKIVNGTLIDGTGKPGRRADVAVKDGLIAAIGPCDEPAERVIDAEGAIVTPGFVDIHTHYDGQISWDDALAPSCFHGVTTAVMGSCGVGFAPCRETDRDRLIKLMEGVEDIPGTALAEGLTWDWESFPEYLEAIDSRPHTIDFAAHIPHDPLRVFVMGDRAIAEEVATDEDIAKMRDLVRDALKPGAVGFSTGRTDNHRAADGSHTPSAEATIRELAGIADAFEGFSHGVLQAVSDFDMVDSPKLFDAEFDTLEAMAKAAHGHPLSISLMQRNRNTEQWRQILKRAEAATEAGVPIFLQVGSRGIGVILGLEATFHPFIGFPSYKAISHLSLEERVQRMRDPEFRAKLLTETSDKVAGDGSAIPPIADLFLQNLDFVAMRLYRLDHDFDYEPPREDSLLAEAFKTDTPVLAVMYDAMLEDDGKSLLYFPIFNYLDFNLDVVREMLTHPLALPGLSDGGAHVGTICDASMSTFMLSHWARDRERGRLKLERVIQMMTSDTANYIGMKDRGVIALGKKADLNVIDFENLSLKRPRMVKDLPAGGQRFLQDASGYRATIVSGQVIIENDQLTDARPGRLVRVR